MKTATLLERRSYPRKPQEQQQQQQQQRKFPKTAYSGKSNA
jgi:hypothetical protein